MEYLSIVVPIILAFVFYKKTISSYSRYLSIPVLLSMEHSAFINSSIFAYNIPFTPFILTWPTFLLLVVVMETTIIWAKCNNTHNNSNKNIILRIVIAFIVLIIVNIPIAWFANGRIRWGDLWTVLGQLPFPVFIFMWLYFIKVIELRNIDILMDVISWVTVALGGLYILNSIGLPIYPYQPYLVISTGLDQTIVRDFATIPKWLFVSFGWLLTKKSVSSFLGLIVLYFVGVFTYTRSLVIALTLAIGVNIIVQLLGKRKYSYIFAMIFIGIPSFFLINSIISSTRQGAIGVLVGRFEELKNSSYQESSLYARSQSFSMIYSNRLAFNKYFGYGLRNYETNSQSQQAIEDIPTVLGDSTWILTQFRYGLIGVIILGGLFLVTSIIYIKRIINYNNDRHTLFVLYSVIMLSMISFASLLEPFPTASVFAYAVYIMQTKRRKVLQNYIQTDQKESLSEANVTRHTP